MSERPIIGHYVFECGAKMPVREQADFTHRRARDGRGRLVVYDSESTTLLRPTHANGQPGNCRFGCPQKRPAGRQETRCYPSEGPEHDEHGRLRWRQVVTCYPAFEPIAEEPKPCPTSPSAPSPSA